MFITSLRIDREPIPGDHATLVLLFRRRTSPGVSVDTWFETDGRSLTQVVDHTSKSYAYPIMADPSWSEIWDKMKSVGKTAWSGVKWVAGKGKVLARRVGPGAPVLCAVGGGWAWYRSDADGWVRVGDAVSGCIL